MGAAAASAVPALSVWLKSVLKARKSKDLKIRITYEDGTVKEIHEHLNPVEVQELLDKLRDSLTKVPDDEVKQFLKTARDIPANEKV